MKRTILLSLLMVAAFQPALARTRPDRTNRRVVPQKARGLTGTYRNHKSEFRIQALGVNRLRVQFDGTYDYKVNGQLMANTGTADGMTTVKDDTAVFIPPDTQGCTITLKFAGQKLIVKQTGSDADCGFGHNVYADGTYIKRSNRTPKFTTY